MKISFGFVNIAAKAIKDILVDVTNNMMVMDYNIGALAKAQKRKNTE